MKTPRAVLALLCLLCLHANARSGIRQDPAALGIDLSMQDRCDPLTPEACLLPFPNDYFTVRDRLSSTRLRVNFVAESLPANVDGVHMDPTDWNRAEGFSPGSAVLIWAPGVDLTRSGAPPITDIGRSLDADSPLVLVDAVTRARWPFWAEVDLNSPPEERVLILRPAVALTEGHRFVVGVRGLVDGTGTPLTPSPAFVAYRDRLRTTDRTFERRRRRMKRVFRTLRRAGVDQFTLQQAWEFTVTSAQSIAGRMLAIRDDAFGALGDDAPVFNVTTVTENPRPEFIRRVQGTYEVPLYLTGSGGPGERFALDANGIPQRQPGTLTATFTCNIPPAAATTPARMALYGHGLLGDQGEVNGSLVRTMSATYNIVYCATDFIGMAEEDIPNAISILLDLGRFPTLADRLQQGLLNVLFLGRLMQHPDGFSSNDAFRIGGQSVLKIDELYYDGNSQGAILGGALCAVAQDISRCVLGEAGMNYSLLLHRSVDFDLYKAVLDNSYPDPFVQLQGISLIQMLWDRGETDGYAQHLTSAPFPNTSAKPTLLLGAVGDHQVSEFALQVEARTIGAAGHVPYVAPGREFGGEHGFGITPIDHYPWPGSAYFLFDTGAELSPLGNVPPRVGHDPHDDTPRIPAVQALKDAFWHPDGAVPDVCGGAPCTGPQF